jgi:hypothetical protein
MIPFVVRQRPQTCSHCLRTVGSRVGRCYTTERIDRRTPAEVRANRAPVIGVFHRCADQAACAAHRAKTEMGAQR